MSLKDDFIKWVKENYTGRIMENIPKDIDWSSEFYYKIDEKQYGPIQINDIPNKFRGK